MSAFALVAGHEFVHMRGWWSEFGNIPLINSGMSEILDEHIHNHHKNVGTPADPATYELGSNYFLTVPGRVFLYNKGSFERFEHRIKEKHGFNSWMLTLTCNKYLFYKAIEAAIVFLVWFCFGYGGAVVQMWTMFYGHFWLEFLNYIEHYGLLRMKDKNGIYDPISYSDSW